MTPFDFRPRTRVVFGAGEISRLGELARELGGTRCLVIADPDTVKAGYAQDAIRSLKARRIGVAAFHDFDMTPTVEMVEAGRAVAAGFNPDLIVGMGDGSSLDFAKAVNVVISCGGSIRDYWGYGNVPKPLASMIAIPTTAGSGSEAQSGASIFDREAHAKMICGDTKLAFRLAILDPKLTLTQSMERTAASGYDAIAHSLETLASTRRTPVSECFSREAWRILNANFQRAIEYPEDLEARSAMLVGSHFAGVAVENSSLGPAHACAYPLATEYKLSHGVSVALTLAATINWVNAASDGESGEQDGLVERLRDLAGIAGFPRSLGDAAIPEQALPRLAEQAATQWSGRFSSRRFDAAAALEIYRAAF